MDTLRSEDGDASERELLVDDIQRIREVLHISAGGGINKLSSDEEEGEGSEEEDEEDDEREKNEEGSLIGVTSNNSQDQNVNYVPPLKSKISSPEVEDVTEQASLSGREAPVAVPDSSHVPEALSVFPVQALVENNLLASHSTGNVSSDEYVLTELQPPTSVPSASQEGYHNVSWLGEINQLHGQNDVNQQEGEEDLFHGGNDEINGDPEMHSEIQQCLSLNRDYQLAILDELERIELSLAKNREKQYGLQQMRANRDEGKPEPHTLVKFANPYFKDLSSMGPPDNDDSKIKRQTCQVGGYRTSSNFWNQKEKNNLAEGVRMQNLENKLSPVLQKIQKLEHKKEKTESELRELEDLKAESLRIKNLPKEKLEHDLEAIDWDRIGGTYVQKRSGFQCRLQWCNFGHPDVNRTQWTKEEDKMLIKLAKEPQNTWDVIAQKLQTKRTPIHCYERYQRSLNKNLLKSKWTPEDDQQLLQVVQIVGLGNWPRVASFLEGRQGDQCLHRYTQTLRMVKKGKWDEDEDELLKKAVEKYGACNWNRLSEMVPGRSGPQCRERWVNALDPNINKGPWTSAQDQKLLENVEKFGKGNWSKIARALGDRTDNQCWRRWIVLRKDDFLYYRQNTLRKKRELVANFTGRRQERPSLEPEDLDIPDVPVLRKRKGRVPLPIEESRARRRATRARFREKKRAEKREAERREAEKRQTEESSEETSPSKEQNTASGGGEEEAKDDGNDEEGGSSESKKNQHVRKSGGNRNRVQQPHHRVLMKNKQLSKRKQVAEKREKRHTESTSGEKQVTVSGSLGPFSLLLQAFSIDIPTVLQAIQKNSSTSSTSTPSSGTNVTADAGNTPGGEKIISGDQQSDVQTCRFALGQESRQTNVSGINSNPQSPTKTQVEARDVAPGGQTTPVPQNQGKAQKANETTVVEGKGNQVDRHQAAKSTDTEPAVGAQISNEENNSGTLSAHATTNTDRVQTGNESTAAKQTSAAVSSTSQATRRRAPAIPPLPPCFTTLKTFKSLLLLRPHLQQIAAVLNTSPADNTAGSLAFQPSSTEGAAGNHSNQVSNVTCVSGNEAGDAFNGSRGGNVESSGNTGKDPVNNSRDIAVNDHVVSPGRARHTEGGNKSGKQLPGSQQIQISEIPNGAEAISSNRDSSCVQTGVFPEPTRTSNEETNISPSRNSSQEKAATVSPGIPLNNTSYRNSYEYKILSSRFNSLFLWPALLSKIPVRGSSQIGPVFAERHPPPRGGDGNSTVNTAAPKRKPAALLQMGASRRKRPGLAAVRMASSASLSTPGQQMCIVGQGSAITPARQPEDPLGLKEVVVAASQLVSLQETSRSLSISCTGNSPYNLRNSKRKATPVKQSSNQTSNSSESKRRKFVESSDSSLSSQEDSSSSEDDSLESDYSPVKSMRNTMETNAVKSTRQSSRKSETAKLPLDIQATPSATTGKAVHADEIMSIHDASSSDSADEEETDVRQAQGKRTTGQQSGATANEQLSKKSLLSKNNSPSSSFKRKNSKPEKNRGARWRAMLPSVDSEESDVQ